MKNLIKNSEDRIKELQELMALFHKNTDPSIDWFKDSLRESKKFEAIWLKKLIMEKTYENDGLNPPFCYRY